MILFQIWRFVTPGLKATERRYAIPFVLSAFVLFLLGAADGVHHAAPRTGLAEVRRWPEPAGDLRPDPVPGPDPLDDDDLRPDLRVPRRPRLARAAPGSSRRRACSAPGAGRSSSSWWSPPSSPRARTPSPCSPSPSLSSSSTSSPSASGSCSAVDRLPMARPGDGRGGGIRGRPPIRPRRLPARGVPRPGLGALGAGVRPDRLGQDAGGGLRRPPRPVGPRQGLLHDAAQGPLEPEVRRARRLLRRGARRAAHRRHHAAPEGARRRHDHRGAAQHAAGRLGPPRGAAHRGPRRGPLHSGPLPGRGLGGGPRPVPGRGPLRLPLGHGEQRQRARRLAALGARGHRRDRGAATADRAAPSLRRLPTRGRRDPAAAFSCTTTGSRAARDCASTRRCGEPCRGRVGPLAGPGEGTAPALPRPPAHRDGRRARPARNAARPSSSSSAGPPATTPCTRSCATACASPTPPSARPSARSSSAGSSRSDDDDLGVLGYDEWLEGLERGVAAHHAGLVPVFRETVEECFAAGLLKVVFATETLSLGHQHAGPLRRDRALHQVRRRRPGHAHVGGVPPAHGPGRAPGPRRGGPRRRRLVERDHLRGGRPGGVGPAAGPALGLPAHLQPRGQPRLAVRPGHGRGRAAALLRPVAGPQARSRSRSSWTIGSPSWSRWATSTGGR